MANLKSLRNSFIKINFSNEGRSIYAPSNDFGGDVILFSVVSESFPHLLKSDVTVIGGRLDGSPVPTDKEFFDLIPLSDKDVELFTSLIYGPDKNAAVFPFGSKTLFVFTRSLRAGGAGLAFIIDIPPSCAAALTPSADAYSYSSDRIVFCLCR